MSGTAQIKNQEISPRALPSEWNSYRAAKYRCTHPNASDWKYYGGRGIEFRFESFAQFVAELGLKSSPDLTVDRIDVNGHYEPGNVVWANRREQMNNIRNNHTLTYKGETLTIAEWSRRTGIKQRNFHFRVRAGWCNDCIFSTDAKTCVHGYDFRRNMRNAANNRAGNKLITHDGVTQTVAQWSRVANLKYTTILRRIDTYNFCVSCALTLKPREKCVHKFQTTRSKRFDVYRLNV